MCNVYTFPISLCLSAARSLYHIKIQHNRIGIYLRLALLTIFIHECGTTISNRPLNFIEKHIFSPPSKAPSKSNQFHPPIAIFVVFIYIFSRLLLNGIESKIGLYLKKKNSFGLRSITCMAHKLIRLVQTVFSQFTLTGISNLEKWCYSGI